MTDAMFNFLARRIQKPTLALVAHQPTLRRIFALQAALSYRPTRGVRIDPAVEGGVPGLRIRPDGVMGPVSLLYLHGGGFTIGSANTHKWLAARIAKSARCAVFVPDYRLAPEHPFPAAMNDVEAAYDALAAHGPVSVAGDSAGGTLAFALCVRRRPRAAVLIAPVADMTQPMTDPSVDYTTEMLIPRAWAKRALSAYIGDADPADPRLSPILGDLGQMPPTLIQAARGEVLETHAQRIKDAVPHAELQITPNAPHVWHLNAGWNGTADAAIKRIGTFLTDHA